LIGDNYDGPRVCGIDGCKKSFKTKSSWDKHIVSKHTLYYKCEGKYFMVKEGI